MHRFMKFRAIRIPSLALLLAVISMYCSVNPEKRNSNETEKPLIGLLICMTEETPFFVSLVKGAKESSDELNADLIVYYAHDDPALQIEQMKKLARAGADAILLNPVSDDVCYAIFEVISLGIPVFTIDRSAGCDEVICHIASNNIEGGMMAGVYLSEALNRKGLVVEIRGTAGSSAAEERGRGFKEAIDNYPEIRIVASIPANFNRHESEIAFEKILDEFPKIDGVFAHNDDMILGSIDASKRANRLNGIFFIGFDGTEEAITSMEINELMATIAQRPEEMGRIGVETALKYLSGQEVPDTIFIELALITK